MITVRPVVKRDVHNLSQMTVNFVNEYDGKVTELATSLKRNILDNKEWYRIVESDGKPIGYYNVLLISDGISQWKLIRDVYVIPEARGAGVARRVRQLARQQDRTVGTTISYGRVRKNLQYFLDQGFNFVAYDPNEHGGHDFNLCVLLYEDHQSYNTVALTHPTLSEFQNNVKLYSSAIERVYLQARQAAEFL